MKWSRATFFRAIGDLSPVETIVGGLDYFRLVDQLTWNLFDERRKAGSALPEPGQERDASGDQRYASDATEQFSPYQDLFGHYEERNHDHPEQIHDACHEEKRHQHPATS